MAQLKHVWPPSTTRWWVRCTEETARMMEQLDAPPPPEARASSGRSLRSWTASPTSCTIFC